MRNLRAFLLIVVVVAVLTFGSRLVVIGQNQDTSGGVTCDADLILLWYTAERYFAFGAVQNTLAQSDSTGAVDLNRINQGQFTSLFNALRSVQDPNTMLVPGTDLSQEWLNALNATMQLDDASFQDFTNSMQSPDVGAFVNLPSISVAGEAPECAQLRGQLRRFFAAIAFHDLDSGFSATTGFNINGNVNINQNANTNANANANVNTNTNVNTNLNTNDNVGNSNDNDDDSSGRGSDEDNSGSGSSDSGSDDDSSGSGSDNSGSDSSSDD